MIELVVYYLPFLAYRYYDKDINRAIGVLMGITFIYFIPVFIYITDYTDCFYFIEKPGEYYRRHPTTYLLGIPIALAVFLFFEIRKKKILKKFEDYESNYEELKRKNKNRVLIFALFTILYLVAFITLMAMHTIPEIKNCWCK
jgi:hypothetical protein